MNESHITVHGHVVAAPVVKKIGEHTVANFRIGVTPRRLDKATGEWRDAETQWYAVSAWRQLGENCGMALRKGDPVIVQGRLVARTWVNAQHAEVVAHDIEASFVGHDLRRGVTHFFKTAAPEPAPEAQPQAIQQAIQQEARDVSPGPQLPGDLERLIGDDGEAPREKAGPADWNAPLADAADLAGAA